MNFHNISKETLISRSDCEVAVKVFISADCEYFDGHFPNFPLLPAVAQIDLVTHLAEKYLGLSIPVKELKRIKFCEKILPETELIFKIKFDSYKQKVNFEILSNDETITYSNGNYY